MELGILTSIVIIMNLYILFVHYSILYYVFFFFVVNTKSFNWVSRPFCDTFYSVAYPQYYTVLAHPEYFHFNAQSKYSILIQPVRPLMNVGIAYLLFSFFICHHRPLTTSTLDCTFINRLITYSYII